MNKTVSAIVATAAVAGALRFGGQYGPQRPITALWYASLRKPSYTPPGPAIGVAWTILGGLLVYTGYRLMAASPPTPQRQRALASWALTVVGIAIYPWLFFGRKMLAASAAVTGLMMATSTATVATAAGVDRKAALAAAPLVGWIGFAGLLSEELWRKND